MSSETDDIILDYSVGMVEIKHETKIDASGLQHLRTYCFFSGLTKWFTTEEGWKSSGDTASAILALISPALSGKATVRGTH